MIYNRRLYLREELYFPGTSYLMRFSLSMNLTCVFNLPWKPLSLSDVWRFTPFQLPAVHESLHLRSCTPWHRRWDGRIPPSLQLPVPSLPISGLTLPCEGQLMTVCDTPQPIAFLQSPKRVHTVSADFQRTGLLLQAPGLAPHCWTRSHEVWGTSSVF